MKKKIENKQRVVEYNQFRRHFARYNFFWPLRTVSKTEMLSSMFGQWFNGFDVVPLIHLKLGSLLLQCARRWLCQILTHMWCPSSGQVCARVLVVVVPGVVVEGMRWTNAFQSERSSNTLNARCLAFIHISARTPTRYCNFRPNSVVRFCWFSFMFLFRFGSGACGFRL